MAINSLTILIVAYNFNIMNWMIAGIKKMEKKMIRIFFLVWFGLVGFMAYQPL